jgi:hypothetical protein
MTVIPGPPFRVQRFLEVHCTPEDRRYSVVAGRPAGKRLHRLPGQERDPGGPPARGIAAKVADDRFGSATPWTRPIALAT